MLSQATSHKFLFLGVSIPRKMANLKRVFVYGTLKKGLPNHKLLSEIPEEETAVFLSEAFTSEKFPVVIGSSDYFPSMLDVPGIGEV